MYRRDGESGNSTHGFDAGIESPLIFAGHGRDPPQNPAILVSAM